ncbi:MAG: S-adenosylmethionine:tRNA ribosyltransferase-isomerase [Actinomycetia bacterium]|nr:S-adenosylmethionine:tRNA ribosyltransferase-isomerase [Actinomycetes bacterium]
MTPPTTPSTSLITPPTTPSTSLVNFDLPAVLEAREPPEARGLARDGVRLMVSRSRAQAVTHHRFTDLPSLLLPGDLLVVNTSRTLPAAIRAGDLEVHFSGQLPDGAWLAEFRQASGKSSIPHAAVVPGQVIGLPGGASLRVAGPAGARLWRVRASVAVVPYLLRHGFPIRYSYAAGGEWPLAAYQTVFGTAPGSAEMPSAARPFTPELVTALVTRGVAIAPVTLHCGVSSLEGGEDPYPEWFEVPPATARLVNLTRHCGGRVIAAGTTVVRALESAVVTSPLSVPASVSARAGWTNHVVTPETGVRVVDGLLTGLHEPRSSHLRMLAAFHPGDLLERCYGQALEQGYLWHEFGDVHLMLP